MSDTLTYQTPMDPSATPLRTGTWIYILVLGILYCVGGLCVGGSTLFAMTLVARAGAPPAGFKTIMLIVSIVMFIIPGAFGATYIWSAIRIRKNSRPAALTAMVIAIINACLLLLIVVLGIVAALVNPRRDPASLVGVVFYLLPAGMNIAAVVLIIKLLQQWRQFR